MFLAIKRKYPNKPPTAKTIQFVILLNGCFKLTRKEKAFLPLLLITLHDKNQLICRTFTQLQKFQDSSQSSCAQAGILEQYSKSDPL